MATSAGVVTMIHVSIFSSLAKSPLNHVEMWLNHYT